MQKLENDMHTKKRQRAEADFGRVFSETLPEEEESVAISRQVLEDKWDIYERIKMLEGENIQLENKLSNLHEEVEILRRELSI